MLKGGTCNGVVTVTVGNDNMMQQLEGIPEGRHSTVAMQAPSALQGGAAQPLLG